MSFSTDLDTLLAKVQSRVDTAMSEARKELTEMAVAAEKEWAELRQRFGEACDESPKTPEPETTSQSETSTNHAGEQPTG